MGSNAPSTQRPSRFTLLADIVGREKSSASAEADQSWLTAPHALGKEIAGVSLVASRMLHVLDIAHSRILVVSAAHPEMLNETLPDDLRHFAETHDDPRVGRAVTWSYGTPFDQLLEMRLGADLEGKLGKGEMQSLRTHAWRSFMPARGPAPAQEVGSVAYVMARIGSSICSLLAAAVAVDDQVAIPLARAASMLRRGNLPLSLHDDGAFVIMTA